MKKYLQALDLYNMLLSAVIFALSSAVFSSLLLKNLGDIVGAFVESSEGDRFDFAEIFAQTSNAELTFSWLLPFCLGLLCAFLSINVFSKLKTAKAQSRASICAFAFLLLVSYISCLALTKVNGIRFCDLLFKLIPLIDKL